MDAGATKVKPSAAASKHSKAAKEKMFQPIKGSRADRRSAGREKGVREKGVKGERGQDSLMSNP